MPDETEKKILAYIERRASDLRIKKRDPAYVLLVDLANDIRAGLHWVDVPAEHKKT